MYHIYIWIETSTMIWIKFTGSSASNRNDMKPNNRERIDILTVGLSVRRKNKKRTVDGDRQTPGVVGRRRPAISRDGAFQKPDTPPTPCRDARRRRLRSLLSRHRWHVGDGMGKRRQRSSVARKRWISRCKGRRLALYLYTRLTQQIGKQSITVLWKLRAPARVEAGNRWTIHTHVVRARPLAPPARPGEARQASAHARVVLPFPLPNCFNKMEVAQLFKLASLHLK